MALSAFRLDQIEARPLEWLWFPYIARGKCTIVEGQPGVGKSTVALDLVARLSRGAAMPGESEGSGKGVRSLILAADHDAADVQSRLAGVGADLSRVNVVTEPLRLVDAEAVGELEELITRLGVDLLVVDSLPAWVGRGVRWRDESQIREALRPLIEMATRLRVALVLLMPSLPGRGRSVGTCGVFSVALEVVDHPSIAGAVLLVMTRSNIGPKREAIVARLWLDAPVLELAKWFDALERELSKPLLQSGVGGLAGWREPTATLAG